MSNYKKHLIGGIVSVGILILLNCFFNFLSISLKTYLLIIPITLIYSLLPDIDIGTSKIRKIITVFFLVLIIYFFIIKNTVFGIIVTVLLILIQFLKHRKLTHTIWFGILISAPLLYDSYILAICGFVSFMSHIGLDKIKRKKK